MPFPKLAFKDASPKFSPAVVMMISDLLGAAPPTDPAIVLPDRGRHISYGDLKRQVEVVAAALAAAGVRRTDRVAIALPNGLPMVVSLLAASTAAAAAPLNPGYTEDEFRFYLNDVNARVALAPNGGAEPLRRAAGDRVRVLSVDLEPDAIVNIQDLDGSMEPDPPDADDTALVLHTSGGTGRPKRVPLTHANLSTSARNVARSYNLAAGDVSLCVMPLFHVHGLVASILGTFAAGGSVVLPEKFNPLSFWRMAQQHGVTWYSAVPTLHQMLLSRVDAPGGRPSAEGRLRFIRSCSAALAPLRHQQMEDAFGVPVVDAYGMTEAAHQITTNPLPPLARKPGTVGPGGFVDVSIVDTDGRHLARGERGEVVIKGANVIDAYENNPEANVESFVGQWFRTGDVGYMDSDGYVTLVARIKELINRGGGKVSPAEIDDVLLAHPAVAEAVCFGVPHPIWGEEVAAAVVLRRAISESDLVSYCREKLADYKRPKRIHIAAAIPRTATGKIQRRVVAEAFSERALRE